MIRQSFGPGFMSLVSVTLVCLLMLAPVTRATSTRITSLGGDGDYFADSLHVVRWFGCLPDYPNLGILELGELGEAEADAGDAPVRQGAGFHHRLDGVGQWGTVAVYLSAVDEAGQVPGTVTTAWARAFGRWQVGLFHSWTRIWQSAEQQTSSNLSRVEENRVCGLGLRAELGERLYGDLAGEWIGTNREYVDTAADLRQKETGAWQSFAWRWRLFIGLGDRIVLVPVVAHTRQVHLTSVMGPPQVAFRDGRLTSVGLGINVFPDSDNMLLVSYERRLGAEDYLPAQMSAPDSPHLENSYRSHRLRVGLESRVLSWLTLRGGALQVVPDHEFAVHFRWDGSTSTSLSYEGEPRLELTVGLGLHFGAFDADFAISDGAPFSFGHFLTGAGESERQHFSAITLAYHF